MSLLGKKKEEEGAAASSEGAQQKAQKPSAKAESGADPNVQAQKPEDEKPAPLTDAERAAAPQHVLDAAERMGGSVPLGAPNNGDELGRVRAVDGAYPDTAPVPAAGDYRAAPFAPGAQRPERQAWTGARPTLAELTEPGNVIEARTLDANSGGIYSGGARIGPDAQDIDIDLVRGRSDAHLAQLLADPRIELRHKPKQK